MWERTILAAIAVTLSVTAAPVTTQESHPVGSHDGIPVAVFLYDGALLMDYGIAAEMFMAANSMRSFRVYTVARKKTVDVNLLGTTTVDYMLENAPVPKVVVVPGGPQWAAEAGEADTVAYLVRVQKEGAILFSVCSGGLLLAKAGLLDGRRATTHHGAIHMMRKLAPDARPTEDSFVDDGNLLTAAGPGTAMDATLYLVARLTTDKIAADLSSSYLNYPHGPPPVP